MFCEMRIKAYAKVIATLLLFAIGSTVEGGTPSKKSSPSSDAKKSVSTPETKAESEKAHYGFAPGTTITLTPRKKKYFFGENILLDYTISYKGKRKIAIWTASGLRTESCYVTATDKKGTRVPESTLMTQYNGSSCRTLEKGTAYVFAVPLMRYCRFEKPGKYRIRVALDLGWSKRDYPGQLSPVPPNDPRWAETAIVLEMPNAEKARQIVKHMQGLHVHADKFRHCHFYKMPDYADYMCLQYPVYLPILQELASAPKGDKDALMGIAHIPTPEATEALVRLLKHPDRDFAFQAAGALNDRLPDVKTTVKRERINPVRAEDADPQLVKNTWQNQFAVPVRQFARELLSEKSSLAWLSNPTKRRRDKEPIRLRCGAFMLESIGTTDDLPTLMAAFEQAIRETKRAAKKSTLIDWCKYHGESPERQVCMAMLHAVEAIMARGAEPKSNPQIPSEIIPFLLAIQQRDSFRPAGWEKRWADALQHKDTFIREVAVLNAPASIPESLHKQYMAGLRSLIATTKEPCILHRATQIALDQKVPADEVIAMLVDRYDCQPMMDYISGCINDILTEGKLGKTAWNYHDATLLIDLDDSKKIARFKDGWKRFLKKNRQAIRKGVKFDYLDIYDFLEEEKEKEEKSQLKTKP